MKTHRSVLALIGNTPAVWLDRITRARGLDGRIMAKLEYLSPGHSKKDRAALGILDEAASKGELAPGQTVVEMTSGNMGTGLAIICAVRGHPFVAVMSAGNSPERAAMMRAFGAEVVLVGQVDGVPGQVTGADLVAAETEAERIAAERGAFRADQFHRAGNPLAHALGTGMEIWEQSGGTITAFADFAGSGGSYAGCMRTLKTLGKVRGYVVEPEGAEVLAGRAVTAAAHPIQGGGYARKLGFMEGAPVDGYLAVSGGQAKAAAQVLAREEGIFGGYSSGANLAAALKLLEGSQAGGRVAILIPDSGMKYLSTDLWGDPEPGI